MAGIHIERFIAGLHTNRAAINTPFRVSYGHPIVYRDALIDGSNVEITPANTLARRPGWSKYCTAQFVGESANGLAGANLASTLHVLLSTTANVYDVGASTLTSIYTKGTTAQTFFQQVGNYLFFSDGNANKKWDGSNLTNNGIAAPTTAPTINKLNLYDTVGAAQTVHAWVPGYTYTNTTSAAQNYFLMAPTGEIYWTVIPRGTNLTSQTSVPNWTSQFGIIGGVVNDGQLQWTNCGVLLTWKANTGSSVYSNSAYVTTGSFNSKQTMATLTTSGSSSFGAWVVGSPSPNPFNEVAYIVGATGVGATNTLLCEGGGFNVPAGATINGIKVSIDVATSGVNAISDNTVQLLKAGVAAGNNKNAGQWPYNPSGPLVTRTYGSNTDLWGTTWTPTDINNANFGFQLILNVNSSKSIGVGVANINITVYYTISSSDISGTVFASVITDSNGNLQRVKVLGTTGGSAPAWSTTIGGTTTDNTMTWECLGTANQLPCLFSRTYAYGFHTNSAHLSTMSPTLTVLAPIIGNNVPVTANGTNDTQCDHVDLYRTTDGGSLLLYDASQPNVNASTSWTVTDVALDTDLNALLIGPVAHANDPPPAGMTVLAYHMGRLWGLVGNLLYFSAGPDCINGDGNQAWPPANVFTLSAPGTALAPTTQGLVVCTGVDISAVLGGPQLNTFWLQPIFKNIGVQSPNCLTQDGDEIIMLTSQQNAVTLSASGKNEFGFTVAPTIAANFPAGTSYIAAHRAGQDQGIFLTDGSTNQMRFNLNAEAWDPIGTPANGITALASVDTAVGTRRLLSTAGGYVVFRDVNTFSDAGTAYSAFATIGSIVVTEGGEKPAKIETIVLQGAAVGTALTVAVLVNEISGSFTTIPFSKADPWQLPATSTITQKAYDWKGAQSMLAQIVRHLQVKITMPGTDTVKNEIYTVALV